MRMFPAIKKSSISHPPSTIYFIFIFTIVLSCSGCFRRFVQTDKQIKAYYKDKPVKPTYFTIRNDSVKLFCAVAGADTLPPLLIVHGAPGAWYGSRNLLDDSIITSHFQVISVDRPGYDKSEFKGSLKAVTSISLQATIIYEALQLNHSSKKGMIMGSSYGGPIAASIAISHPEKFYHLLLLAAAIDPDNEKFWWFNKYSHHGPVKWMLPHFMKSATNEKYAHVKELRQLLPRWSQLTIHVTAVQGEADKIVKPVNLEFAKKVLAGKQATFIYLPGVDHLIRWQRADLVRELILNAK